MAYEVLMPQLGLTMEEGTVNYWIMHEGDALGLAMCSLRSPPIS